MQIKSRYLFAAIFVACAALLGFALFLQQSEGLEPCPMCILQRYAYIAVGIVALVAAIHAPRGKGLMAYAIVAALFALLGAGVAIRHSYLQHYPPAVESCGTDLEFLLDTFPLTQALPKIFAGTGSCSKVDWRLLGLSIPEWNIVCYLALAGLAVWAAFRRQPPR